MKTYKLMATEGRLVADEIYDELSEWAAGEKRRPRAKRVLVVEDDRTLKPILGAILHKVDPAISVDWLDSAEALFHRSQAAKLQAGYDVVLTDIYMPGDATGIDVLNHFSKWSPTTPIVIMSGMNQLEFNRSFRSDFRRAIYMAKPINLWRWETLLSRLIGTSFSV